jgi:hypothetical protein
MMSIIVTIYGTVVAREKGRSCQGVKYVFDAHTSKASKRLKVVPLHLCRINIKTTGGLINIPVENLHMVKTAP